MQKQKAESFVTVSHWWHYEKDRRSKKNFARRVIRKIESFLIHKRKTLNEASFSYCESEEARKASWLKLADYLADYFRPYFFSITAEDVYADIEEWDFISRSKAISSQAGGMKYNNGLITFVICKLVNPSICIESGVWRGMTTLILDKSSKADSKIYCFDITYSKREYCSSKAIYTQGDMTDVEFLNDIIDYADLILFDDHVSHYERIKLCMNSSAILIMDDDVSLGAVHSDGWPPIPTTDMIYNYEEIPHEFRWVRNGLIGEAKISDLIVQDIINKYKRLLYPDISRYTGYINQGFASVLIPAH